MSHQKLLNSILRQKNNNTPETKKTQPSLKDLMSVLNMFDPNHKEKDDDETSKVSDRTMKLDKMYIKNIDLKNINKYLYCEEIGNYLPVGYRYAGKSTNKKTGIKTFLFVRKNESGLYVVHCMGKKIEPHQDYNVYEPIDITKQLPNNIMQMIKDGTIVNL